MHTSDADETVRTRREFLTLLSYALAAPGASQFFSAWLHAANRQSSSRAIRLDAPPEPPLLRNYEPKFFDAADFEALQAPFPHCGHP